MASGAHVSKEIGEAVGVVGVSSEKQQIGEAGGLDGVIDEESRVGVEIRVSETVELGTETGAAPANQVNAEEQAGGGEIGGSSVNQETEEEQVAVGVGEIEVCLVDQLNVEELTVAEVGISSANKESGEVGGENRLVPENQVTGKSGNLDAETLISSDNQVNGEAGKVGGENEVASADCVNDEPGSVQVNWKAKGIDGVIDVVSTGHVSEEGGGMGGESVVTSANQVSGDTQFVGGEIEGTSMNHVSEEAGGIGGQNGVASSIQVTGETKCFGGEIEGASMNHVTEEAGCIVEKIGVASSNQMNVEAECNGGGSGVPSANQVNGEVEDNGGVNGAATVNGVTRKAVGIGGTKWVPTANQVNGIAGGVHGGIGMPSSYQVNKELGIGGEAGMLSSSQVNGISEGVGGGIRVPRVNQVNGEARCVGGEFGVVEKHRWEDTKVYRRRAKGVLSDLITITATTTLTDNSSRSQSEKMHLSEVNTRESNTIDEGNHKHNRVEGNGVPESDKVVSVQSSGDINNSRQIQPETTSDVVSNRELNATGMDCVTLIPVDPRVTNGALNPLLSASEGKVKVNLASTAKLERQQLKRKFESELCSVRKAVKKMDGGREEIVPEFYHPVVNNNLVPNGARSNGFATRVYSGTRSLGHVPYKPNIRPFNQLRVSVIENSHGMVDSIEREKRTPKANTFYRNSEFLLANDKFPPAESNKKSKSNGQMSSGGEFGFGGGSKVYKSCSTLLEKLMKHKHGWVFNAPVDVKALGLHDYFLFIKNPMDLGTVKAKLIKYWYKSPMEFAEDVRLTFHNAMLYNPKGHDVHIMAETLLKLFEGKWPDIELKYLRELRSAVDHDRGFPTPTSRITYPFQSQVVPPLETRVFSNSESISHSVNPKPRTITPVPSLKAPALQKPKAKDVNKREMTYGEKQKLSTNLQGLPPEKLDGVIQIIKKRSTALSQNEDEIEVDIDSVDTETLWELDRYVSNWKKSLSKHRRKAELANQMRAEARLAAEKTTTTQLVPPRESATGYENATLPPPPLQNDQAAKASRSSSSSSSSSSDSSSSDSDSDSSSEESDGVRSPGT